jgi:hypothetical protein
LQIELVTGTILANRGWETEPEELKARTKKALDDALARQTKPKNSSEPKPNSDPKPASDPTEVAKAGDGGSELREFRPWRDYKQRTEAERAESGGEPAKLRRRGLLNLRRESP